MKNILLEWKRVKNEPLAAGYEALNTLSRLFAHVVLEPTAVLM